MVMPIPLLLLEDKQADACSLIEMLENNSQLWQVTSIKHLSAALEHLSHTRFEIALIDLSLPDSQGVEILTQVHAVAPDLPLVVLTSLDDQQLALQAMSRGAQDYLIKGKFTSEVLIRVIRYAIERGRILRQLQTEVLERQRSEKTLRLLVEGTASVTGDAFFRSLVRSLAEALNSRYALISGCINSPPTRVCTFAFWKNRQFSENIEYDLYGTPCEQVFNCQSCQYYPQQVQTFFPNDSGLAELQAQSYAGIPLFSLSGELLGHLAVLDDKPLENEPRNTAILEIFAARAAAEIERQQATESLRISQEKFSKAFRSSPNAITISTLNEGRYIEVNESCLRMLGYDRAEMIGHSVLELGIWAKFEERQTLKQKIEEQGSVANLEIEFRKKSGELFLGLFSAEVIDLENEPCLLSVTTDITLIKQASQALERLAEIGELSSMIVHEIRNPLTTLLMGVNSFKRLDLPERFQEYLRLSLEEGDRLQRLLNQILLYAKPQTLQQSELELNGFVAEMLSSLQTMPAAEGKKLEFVRASCVRVLIDPDKLKQVLINLVTNAFEAIEVGEGVMIAIQLYPSHQVCIQVHNGGNPIPPEILPKLTQPFVTTKLNGNGLGLAIVKRIVEAHGGELAIESSEMIGTTIIVRLPILI
jgi:PAS domain S-box-containing protein